MCLDGEKHSFNCDSRYNRMNGYSFFYRNLFSPVKVGREEKLTSGRSVYYLPTEVLHMSADCFHALVGSQTRTERKSAGGRV